MLADHCTGQPHGRGQGGFHQRVVSHAVAVVGEDAHACVIQCRQISEPLPRPPLRDGR